LNSLFKNTTQIGVFQLLYYYYTKTAHVTKSSFGSDNLDNEKR